MEIAKGEIEFRNLIRYSAVLTWPRPTKFLGNVLQKSRRPHHQPEAIPNQASNMFFYPATATTVISLCKSAPYNYVLSLYFSWFYTGFFLVAPTFLHQLFSLKPTYHPHKCQAWMSLAVHQQTVRTCFLLQGWPKAFLIACTLPGGHNSTICLFTH